MVRFNSAYSIWHVMQVPQLLLVFLRLSPATGCKCAFASCGQTHASHTQNCVALAKRKITPPPAYPPASCRRTTAPTSLVSSSCHAAMTPGWCQVAWTTQCSCMSCHLRGRLRLTGVDDGFGCGVLIADASLALARVSFVLHIVGSVASSAWLCVRGGRELVCPERLMLPFRFVHAACCII